MYAEAYVVVCAGKSQTPHGASVVRFGLQLSRMVVIVWSRQERCKRAYRGWAPWLCVCRRTGETIVRRDRNEQTRKRGRRTARARARSVLSSSIPPPTKKSSIR